MLPYTVTLKPHAHLWAPLRYCLFLSLSLIMFVRWDYNCDEHSFASEASVAAPQKNEQARWCSRMDSTEFTNCTSSVRPEYQRIGKISPVWSSSEAIAPKKDYTAALYFVHQSVNTKVIACPAFWYMTYTRHIQNETPSAQTQPPV